MPSARWVAGIKTVHAPEILKDVPQIPACLYSDDHDALEKVKALFENTQFPIGET